MDFEFNEEHKMLREVVKDFAEKEIAPLVEAAEEKEEFPLELFPKVGDLGYLCTNYPVEYGGGGMGLIGQCIVVEEMSRVCLGIASGLMIQSGIGTEAILAHGTEEQKQEYLIPAVQGRKIGAFGLTEPNAGSDSAAIETTAVKRDGKYVINGNKIYITNGPICDFVLVAAYTDKSLGTRGGVSIFIVEKGTPGFSCAKMKKFCIRSSTTGELTFEDCVVPAENMVGEEGKGFIYLMETLDAGRISHAASSIGLAQAAYEASLDYAQQRVQFGQPIYKFQANSFKLARMAMEIEAARWFMYRSAWLYDQGARRFKEAAMVKLFASEVAQRVTTEAMQIHGGVALMHESPVQRYFRDARRGTITEGTSEIQQMVISRAIGLR
ncbi:acyl-CoA dehydrogenase family protein [Chloroflexota bacterium]